MNRTLFFGIITLLLASNCVTVAPLPKGERYADRVTKGHKMIDGGANFIVEKTPDQHFVVKRFYYETRKQTSQKTYADRALNLLDGSASEWLDDGSLWSAGEYLNGKKTGTWKEFTYLGSKQGKLSTGTYENGLKQGTWTHFDSIGQKVRTLVFEAGELVSSQTIRPDGTVSVDTLYKDSPEKSIQIAPTFPCDPKLESLGKDCNERSLLNYLSRNIRYPLSARQRMITGTAYLSFVVGKEGEVSDIKVNQGLCDEIKAECYRVVSNMPKWNPGSADGKPVKVWYYLPIRFKLED